MVNKNSKYNYLGLVVHVHVNIPSRISCDELLAVSCFSIMVVNSGCLCIKIHNTTITLSKNELIIIPILTSCEILNWTGHLQVSLVSFPSTFIIKNSICRPPIGYFEFFMTKSPNKVSLNSIDTALLIDLFKLLDRKRKTSDKHPFKNEVIHFSFNLFLYELAAIYAKYSRFIKIRHSRKEKLVMQFFRILEANCRRQHGVKFYADALFITTGHLTKTVKEVTKRTTKQFIEEALIVEAKILLQNENWTILHIVEELQFSNASFFSNFFKKYTSMSPSEYRSSLKICCIIKGIG